MHYSTIVTLFFVFTLAHGFASASEVPTVSSYFINGDYVAGDKVVNNISTEDFDRLKKESERLKDENDLLNERVTGLEGQIKEVFERIPNLKQVSKELVSNNSLTSVEKNQIKRRYKLAAKAFKKHDYINAAKYFSGLIDEAAIPSNYVALATSYKQLSQYNLAKENYSMAIELSRGKDEYLNIRLYALEGLADMCIELGKYQDAAIMLKEALNIAERIEDVESKVSVLGLLGNVYDSMAQSKDALSYYDESLKLAEEISDELQQGIQLQNIGILHIKNGDLKSAKYYLERALPIIKKHGDMPNKEIIMGNLGGLYGSLRDFPMALQYLNEALDLARGRNHLIGEGTWLNKLGMVYRALKDYPKAMLLTEQSLNIARKIGDRRGEAARYVSLANVYVDYGDYENAIYFANLAIGLCLQIGDKHNHFIALKNLGIWYMKLNKQDLARQYLNEALVVAEQVFGLTSNEVKEVQQMISCL